MLTNDMVDKMSMDQLTAARDLIAAKIAEKEAAKHAAFLKEIEARAKKAGIDLSKLLKSDKKAAGVVAIKYRNPNNHSETWTGRGIKPRWLARELSRVGRKLADYEVPAAPVATPEAPAAAA